jgi:hypothetical protein
MEAKPSQVGWGFWFQWVFACTLGPVLGSIVGFIIGSIISEDIIGSSVLGEIFAYFMLGAVLGYVVGLMQWFVLRQQISRAGWWALASAAGLAVVISAGIVVAALTNYSVGLDNFSVLLRWVVVMALGGAVIGMLQWLILRGQVSRAGWWMLASTVGWGLSMAVAGVFEFVAVGLFFGLLVGGVVLGAVTGGALVWLLRQPVP